MKLPNGYGSVVKLGGKRRKPYAARITTGWTEDGKQIKKYLGFFKTRQEALKALSEYNENPFDLSAREVTFAEVYERWCKVKFKDEPVKPEYAAAFKNLSALHNMKFAEIRKRHIQAVIDGSPLKRSAKNHMKTVCTQLFKYAIDLEIVSTNYASLAELPKEAQSEVHQPFSEEELKILWANSEDLGARIALILSYTGMRPREFLEMKTANINLEEMYMRGGVKTEASKNRVIPIAEKIFLFIEEMYEEDKEYLLSKDKPLTSNNFRKQIWDKSPVLKGLPGKHLPHDGRHTCATLLDNAEVSLKIQQMILGHTSQSITSRVYTHKTIRQLVDAINKI